jgi:hypothetical protein
MPGSRWGRKSDRFLSAANYDKNPTSAFIALMRFLADSERFAKQWFGFRWLSTANL